MARRNDRAQLLEQVFADRLPQLEAASAASAAYVLALHEIDTARSAAARAGEELRAAYDAAVSAGWSDADLRVVGVERPRRPSPGRPRSARVDAETSAG